MSDDDAQRDGCLQPLLLQSALHCDAIGDECGCLRHLHREEFPPSTIELLKKVPAAQIWVIFVRLYSMSASRHQVGSRVLICGLVQATDRNYSFAVVESAFLHPSEKGCRVRLHGLVAASEHNDKEGIVEVPLNSETGRVGVKIDRSGTAPPLAIKPSNLIPIDPRLSVRLNNRHVLNIKLQHGLPITMHTTSLQLPSAGCMNAHDAHPFTMLLDGFLWHSNCITGKMPAPFDPSHIAALRSTVDGQKTLRMLAEDAIPLWPQVLGSLCSFVQSLSAKGIKPPPFIPDLNEHTDVVHWPQTGISGLFWVCKQNRDGALLIPKGNEVNGAIFCVLGLTHSISSLNAGGAMPFGVSATLLPYRGRITHNNLSQLHPDSSSHYPSQDLAKILEHRVALETPIYSLPSAPYGVAAVTAFSFVEKQ